MGEEGPTHEHVRAPQACVYLGGQAVGMRPDEPHRLPAEHVAALREAGVQLDPHDPTA